MLATPLTSSWLLLTCTGVSFAHGSNGGQKDVRLIVLILVGTIPAAYALNHGVGPAELRNFPGRLEQNGADPRTAAGLQWPTLRAVAAAWILTLPASIVLAGGLFWLFLQLLGKNFSSKPTG